MGLTRAGRAAPELHWGVATVRRESTVRYPVVWGLGAL